MSALQFIKMRLWNEESGQDISEYSLLLAFIFLISLCLFLQNARDVATIWNAASGIIGYGSNVAAKASGGRLP